MKRILFLFAGLIAMSSTAFATNTSTLEAEASVNNYVRGYDNSFIFNEGGIEFSVFRDGQFDFYIPQYGPNVNVGVNTPGFTLSFNSGFNYNPYVQYDSFGAIIQIENTPIFYDYFGRVNQIGNIFINYNRFNRISRIGGLNVFYRNNVFWRYDGFINRFNRAYVWRPWHRFYAVPPVNYCVVNVNPYRQFYTPVRHVYYRPYRNNVRHFNVVNGRRGNANIGGRNSSINNRYVQSPRNSRERSIQRTVTRRNTEITRTRSTRLAANTRTNTIDRSTNTRVRSNRNANRMVRNNSESVRTRSNSRANTNRTVRSTRSKPRVASSANTTRSRSINTPRNERRQVTSNRTSVSNRLGSQTNNSVRKPNTTKHRTYNKVSSQNKRQRSTSVQNKRKSSSVSTRSNTSRRSSQTSTRSNTRRTRG
ncbi:hypothetical protein [uncultured Winogradskyella sp.]|uniref:hypothetical protein n=1 Tax=uncultured Winogradskyella sp. TaxID=395353 RepID=UPI0026182DC5|nr:hypothetical protein [uncultured Winogradskyella sp.]